MQNLCLAIQMEVAYAGHLQRARTPMSREIFGQLAQLDLPLFLREMLV